MLLPNTFKISLLNSHSVMKDPEKEAIVFSVRFIFRKKFLYTANCASREIHVKKFPTNSTEVVCEVHMKFM